MLVQNIGLGVDHYGLNKFGSRTAEYNMIHSKLVELLAPFSFPSWNSVPFHTVSSYTVREDLSSKIKDKLRVKFEDSSLPHALVIYGLGGAGKTQLALRYVEDHGEKYSPILWIDAKSPETVLSSFERCAGALRLSVDRDSRRGPALRESPAVENVLRWLGARDESDEEWLVVIDNADDVSWNLEAIIPRGQRGNVIITSQHPQSRQLLRGNYERLQVGMMEKSEAISLLLKHVDTDQVSATAEVQETTHKIVERLGCLPLAVDLAGAYISEQENRDAALQQYLVEYEQHEDDLLQQESFRQLEPHEKTVWTVWDTTMDAIERRYPELHARDLLTLLAHFHRGLIQDELFRLASQGLPAVARLLRSTQAELPDWLEKYIDMDGVKWDDFHYRQACDVLIRYSLVQRIGGEWPGLTMHGLVQWRAKKRVGDRRWQQWYIMVITAASWQVIWGQNEQQFRRHLITHFPAIQRLDGVTWGMEDKAEERLVSAWNLLGQVYNEEGRWKEAEELFVQAMETSEKLLGRENPSTLTSMANLAPTYRNQGRLREAEELGAHVMETRRKVLGSEHPDTLTSMVHLASTYRDQRRWKEAEELEAQVVEIFKRVLGPEHPSTLTSMVNLALTYLFQGRWKEAEELGVQAMKTGKQVLGSEHPSTLASMANLALTYSNQGRWKEAEELEVQVIEIRTRVLGVEHPDTLTSTANLALTYMSQGRWKEAEELEVQVIKTFKRVLGPEHPSTLTNMANLALTYSNQGRWKEAEELGVQVIEIRTRVLGVEHPDTLTGTANLASTYSSQGRWKEAEELEVQVMEVRKKVLGVEHPDTLTSTANLASTYLSQGRLKEAEELEVQVMETRKKVLGVEHPETLTSMANLAFTWKSQGRDIEALRLMEDCLQLRKLLLGPNHPDTLASVYSLRMWLGDNLAVSL